MKNQPQTMTCIINNNQSTTSNLIPMVEIQSSTFNANRESIASLNIYPPDRDIKKWDENSDVDLKESIHFEDLQYDTKID